LRIDRLRKKMKRVEQVYGLNGSNEGCRSVRWCFDMIANDTAADGDRLSLPFLRSIFRLPKPRYFFTSKRDDANGLDDGSTMVLLSL
jgi:hypothetical protein